MSWAVGFDTRWNRDIGYGVPAFCDEPGCDEKIDRGLAYVCADGEPYGGDEGCGLYFCGKHLRSLPCTHEGFIAKPDHPTWTNHKATHPSWEEWRETQPSYLDPARPVAKGRESE